MIRLIGLVGLLLLGACEDRDTVACGRGHLTAEAGGLISDFTLDGEGVVLSMKALASGDITAGRLVTPFNIALPLESAYYMITLEELTDHPHTEAFRDWLLDEARQEDELDSSQ